MTTATPVSPTNATYVEPSAETILKPGTKLSDLLRRVSPARAPSWTELMR